MTIIWPFGYKKGQRKEVRMDQETLIERLMAENEEFRRLRTEH